MRSLGNTPGTGFGGFAVASGDGYGHETARQLSPAQEIHDWPAYAGCIYESFAAAQFGA